MSSCILNGGIPINIGQLTQAESVVVLIWGVGETINDDGVSVSVVNLSHPTVQLVVSYAGPVDWLLNANNKN